MKSLTEFIQEHCGKYEDDMLLEMANLYPQDTGLRNIVWVQTALPGNHGRHNLPRLEVQFGESLVPVSIEDEPRVLAGNIDAKTFRQVAKWIKVNKDILLRYWEGPMRTGDLMSGIIKS